MHAEAAVVCDFAALLARRDGLIHGRPKRLQTRLTFPLPLGAWSRQWPGPSVVTASPSGPRFAKCISRRPTPVWMFLFFFLFLSKFCQHQIHLSVFSPLFVFVFCSGAGLPFYLLISHLVFTYTNLYTRQLHHQTSQLPVSLRRDNFLH